MRFGAKTMDVSPMSTTDHLRLGMRVLKRFFDIFVVWPATLVACFFFLLGLSGEQVGRNAVEYGYRWGEQTFRTAPAGMALVDISDRSTHSKDRIREDHSITAPPFLIVLSLVPMQEAIDHDVTVLMAYYWACVLVCSGAALIVLGPRRFIGFSISIRNNVSEHPTQD
jgi:hypothetical protein